MTSYHKKIQTLFIICCFLFSGAPTAYCLEDAIIAVVNQETITLKDLRDYINAVYTQLKMDGEHSEDAIRQIMLQVEQEGIDRLIDDRLVLNAAIERGVEAHRPAIDQRINDIRSRYPSEQAFLAALATEGVTITDLRKRIADQLKSQFFIEMEIKSTIQINPREITDYYATHPEQFIKPAYAEVVSIFIPYDENPEEARAQANTIYGQLKLGQDFERMAAQYSQSPSIRTIVKGQMKPHIENQIFNLKSGDFSWPIESDQGMFLFKLKQKFSEQPVPLNDVKDQIAQFLFSQKFKEKMKTWLQKAREKTYIEIKNH